MPKSFLPQQDTGLISVVFKADPDVSFAEMSRLQASPSRPRGRSRRSPTSCRVAGSGTVNPTPNVASLTVVLLPHEARKRDAAEIAAEIEGSLSQIPGVVPFAKPVQDVQIATRSSFSQYQYTLVGSSDRT